MLNRTRNTNTVESVFTSRLTMNNIAPNLQNAGHTKLLSKSHKNMLKQPNFFDSQPSTFPEDAPATSFLSTSFGLSFMISSVASTRSSSFYVYLITKIRNRNFKVTLEDYFQHQGFLHIIICVFLGYKGPNFVKKIGCY